MFLLFYYCLFIYLLDLDFCSTKNFTDENFKKLFLCAIINCNCVLDFFPPFPKFLIFQRFQKQNLYPLSLCLSTLAVWLRSHSSERIEAWILILCLSDLRNRAYKVIDQSCARGRPSGWIWKSPLKQSYQTQSTSV